VCEHILFTPFPQALEKQSLGIKKKKGPDQDRLAQVLSSYQISRPTTFSFLKKDKKIKFEKGEPDRINSRNGYLPPVDRAGGVGPETSRPSNGREVPLSYSRRGSCGGVPSIQRAGGAPRGIPPVRLAGGPPAI
jgi:hypothetical protein